MKKALDEATIINELKGGSLYFRKPVEPPEPDPALQPDTPAPAMPVTGPIDEQPSSTVLSPDTTSNRDTTIPRHHDTTVSRYHDTIIEVVRKAVKELGKEAATHRFTVEEKRAIAGIIYTYTRQGLKTSENEIARIAVNFLIQNYQANGKNSVLHQVLQALHE